MIAKLKPKRTLTKRICNEDRAMMMPPQTLHQVDLRVTAIAGLEFRGNDVYTFLRGLA